MCWGKESLFPFLQDGFTEKKEPLNVKDRISLHTVHIMKDSN